MWKHPNNLGSYYHENSHPLHILHLISSLGHQIHNIDFRPFPNQLHHESVYKPYRDPTWKYKIYNHARMHPLLHTLLSDSDKIYSIPEDILDAAHIPASIHLHKPLSLQDQSLFDTYP